ncbi:hypothetical protein [Kutzneria kofuensis]|uniref:hypothetical protein n=1 Tax=Kutzneria kofuensis TaxID=103725 RepID=UPI0031E6C669
MLRTRARVEGIRVAPPMPWMARGGDQGGGVGGEGGGDRGQAEHGGADQQQGAAADAVADVAHGDQQAGQDEAVHVDDPQLFGAGGGQGGGDGGDGEVQDGHVHGDQQQWQDEDGQAGPFASAGEAGWLRGVCHAPNHTRVPHACIERTFKTLDG